jgi:ABC-2 type transport system permease protein
MQRYGVSRKEDLPVSIDGLRLEESERQGNIVFERNFGALAATYAGQRDVLRWANLLSPLPALQNVSMALAGTDMAHQLAFQNQAEAHRRTLITQLNQDMIDHGAGKDFDYKAGTDLWKSTKDFAFAKPGIGMALRSVWLDALILICWLLAAFALLAAAGRRLGREAL